MLHAGDARGRILLRTTQEVRAGGDHHDARAGEGHFDGGDASILSGSETTDRFEDVRATQTLGPAEAARRWGWTIHHNLDIFTCQ